MVVLTPSSQTLNIRDQRCLSSPVIKPKCICCIRKYIRLEILTDKEKLLFTFYCCCSFSKVSDRRRQQRLPFRCILLHYQVPKRFGVFHLACCLSPKGLACHPTILYVSLHSALFQKALLFICRKRQPKINDTNAPDLWNAIL